MYYIVYGLFYVLSLLPWRLLYFLSDGIYLLIYYIIGYRKKVVFGNLQIAFPEKTEQERIQIAKQFYHNFVDTFIETIKLISVSDKSFEKRFTSNIEVMNNLYEGGQSVQIMAGHLFNWEFINLGVARYSKYPFIGVYMPISNKVFNRLMLKLRGRYGTILLPATDFKNKFHAYIKSRYALGLVADQNPGGPTAGYWVNFFDKLLPFVKGPEKGAKINNTAIVFANYYKVKRGYYNVEFELVTQTPKDYNEGELTQVLATLVERAIRERPGNYLWSHRRWKWEYNEEQFGHLRAKS